LISLKTLFSFMERTILAGLFSRSDCLGTNSLLTLPTCRGVVIAPDIAKRTAVQAELMAELAG
jgi:hypothetical protein